MLPYDPSARRQTPLARELAERIRTGGSISVQAYVDQCLGHDNHGYYRSRTAIGAAADFVTAPEISQVFGELLGIWVALVWQQMGKPDRLRLVELGPGRGTLMTDAFRAITKVANMASAIQLHLVEQNPKLRQQQFERLHHLAPDLVHHETVDELNTAAAMHALPTIVIANEFLDAIGVRQLIVRDGQWYERCITLDGNNRLSFAIATKPALAEQHWPLPGSLDDGTVFECNPAIRATLAPALGGLARRAPLAALLIDYGHETTRVGDTLQAVRRHAYEHPLTSPGEADLTAQVDFAAATRAFCEAGLAVYGPVSQAEFLGRLGIVERTSRLMAANPCQAADLEMATQRLMTPTGMGARFKALGIAGPGLGGLPLLEASTV